MKNETYKTVEENVVENKQDGNKKTNRKKIAIFVSVFIIVILLFALVGWYINERKCNNWELKSDTITIEYGETYNPQINDFVDTDKYKSVTTDNTNFVYNFQNEEGKNFLPIGEYAINVKHTSNYDLFGLNLYSKEETKVVTLLVKDTIAPTVKAPTEVEIAKGTDISKYDFKQYIDVSDLSELGGITLKLDNVKYDTVGEYEVLLTVVDSESNETTAKIKAIIVEVKENQTAETKVVENEDGTKKVALVITDKPTETTSQTTTSTTTSSTNSSTKRKDSSTTTTKPTPNTTTPKPNTSTTTTPKKEENTTSAQKEAYWCTEGGTHHTIDEGNVGGWYKTYDEAKTAARNYLLNKFGGSGRWYVEQCDKCGLWTPEAQEY